MYDEQAESVYRQLQSARSDRSVKGLIVRVNSPGGTISASDQVYQQIRKYRQRQRKAGDCLHAEHRRFRRLLCLRGMR